MTDHNELAARIERAEGPDRALDELIHEASGLPFVMEYYTEYATEQTRNLSYVPRYTASIDAAIQLVPAGHNWAIDTGHKNGISAWCFDGHLWNTDASVAATPALALCAAAIRARSAS